MIELAKERADQRKHLSNATEEVREQARALEELIALPANDYVEAQA